MAQLRRWSRPVRHRLGAWALRGTRVGLRALPRSLVPRIGSLFGRLIGLFARDASGQITHRLEQTISCPPPVGLIWADLGRRAAEFVIADRLLSRVRLAAGSETTFLKAQRLGRGVLLAAAHLGNWELMAAALSSLGFPFEAVAAEPKSGPIGDLLKQHRQELGVRTLSPGQGARRGIRRLKAGGTVAIFVDQSTRERSRPIEFLGIEAPTSLAFARLKETSHAVPLLIWNHRDGSGDYVVHIEEIPDGDQLLWVTTRLGEIIREYPEQWVWLHKRWSERTSRAALQNEVPSPT